MIVFSHQVCHVVFLMVSFLIRCDFVKHLDTKYCAKMLKNS